MALILAFLVWTGLVAMGGAFFGYVWSLQYPRPEEYHPKKEIKLNEQVLWNKVQDWRSSQELATYKNDPWLCDIATVRVGEIQEEFSHRGFAERYSPENRPSNLSHITIGENLAKELPTEQATLDGWLASPTHLSNLKAPYTNSCIECEGQYCVQIFSHI